MARGVNKVILVGNLGADPESRQTASGSTVARIRIATSESWKDKETGQQQEKTEWHRVVFFGRIAEIVAQYLRKGSQVYIEGALRTDKYTGKDGVERYATDVIGSEMQMLGGKQGGQQQSFETQGGAGSQQQSAPAKADDFGDENIPF